MRVTLDQPGVGDAHQPGLRAQVFQRGRAGFLRQLFDLDVNLGRKVGVEVEAAAVVAQFQHQFRAFPAQTQSDGG